MALLDRTEALSRDGYATEAFTATSSRGSWLAHVLLTLCGPNLVLAALGVGLVESSVALVPHAYEGKSRSWTTFEVTVRSEPPVVVAEIDDLSKAEARASLVGEILRVRVEPRSAARAGGHGQE
jgi:hypothetical protein